MIKEILEKLQSDASVKQCKTLEAIYEICQEQVKRGTFDFSYATISRLGADRGVPKAQSMRNKSGQLYQALIKSFVDETSKANPNVKHRKDTAWIDEIKDPKLRILVSIQQSELIEAKRLVREIIPPNTTIVVDDRRGGMAEHRLNDVERRALEFVASNEFLRERKYTAGNRGDVVDSEGNRLFKPGTIDGLKKALRYL